MPTHSKRTRPYALLLLLLVLQVVLIGDVTAVEANDLDRNDDDSDDIEEVSLLKVRVDLSLMISRHLVRDLYARHLLWLNEINNTWLIYSDQLNQLLTRAPTTSRQFFIDLNLQITAIQTKIYRLTERQRSGKELYKQTVDRTFHLLQKDIENRLYFRF
jgi:hypothetical protein